MNNKRILLVEDDASDEKLALMAFNRCGVSWLLFNETPPAGRSES
jgi:hypothetical protein